MTTNYSTSASNEELMSKLMDGDISELELHRLLKSVERDDALRANWSQMNLTQAALNEKVEPVMDLSLADTVRTRIGRADSAHVESTEPSLKRFWRPLGQFAVAASVATLMVLVAPLVKNNEFDDEPSVISGFQSVDETVYDLNAALSLTTPKNRNVSTQMAPEASGLTSSDRELLSQLQQQGGFVAESMSPEEEARVARIMSEYMALHANAAGLNTTSSIRNYLQVAPK